MPPPAPAATVGGKGSGAGSGTTSSGSTSGTGAGTGSSVTGSSGAGAGTSGSGTGGAGTGGAQPIAAGRPTKAKGTAYPTNDPRHVRSLLQGFKPKGNNRAKVATLRDEALILKIEKNPIAFCFLLRSMFEISAKEYSNDNNLPLTNTKVKNGVTNVKDKSLTELLNGATNHLTNNKKDPIRKKILHGAMTELGKSDGLLSVTTMNQLVHNASFSIIAKDICTLFGNIFPLLTLMNS